MTVRSFVMGAGVPHYGTLENAGLLFSTEFGKRSFSYLAPTVWNDLPLDSRLSPTADTFKHRLKTVLFA